MSSFFQKLTYNNFQLLADRYVADIPDPLPQRTATPPQLVKLAFTLDFTAKVAGLSSQAVGRIMGFGNQYIQNRFTQMTSVNCQVSQVVWLMFSVCAEKKEAQIFVHSPGPVNWEQT